MKLENPIILGTIGKAQGLRGEVRVKSHTEDPLSLGDYGVLFTKDGKRFEVLDIRRHKTVVVVRFLGVNDRNAAEALNGTDLFVERANLSDADLEDDEYFYADLEGLEAFDEFGASWGFIKAIFDFGGGDLIELQAKGEKSVIIPFTQAAVVDVDIKAGKIIVDPEAAGLIDDGSSPDDEWPEEGEDPKPES
ncbi:MAG: ribosome maturation factor RimM [Lentilitoribacter sp.]